MRAALVTCLLLELVIIDRVTPVRAAESIGRAWAEAMVQARAALLAETGSDPAAISRAWFAIKERFPVPWDWTLQDAGEDFVRWFETRDEAWMERRLVEKVAAELGASGRELARDLELLEREKVPLSDSRWLELYARGCEWRRERRLHTVLKETPRIVFTKHPTIRPSFFAYTEGQSDAQNERHFRPRAELCLLEMDGLYARRRTLLADQAGAIRDPAVSWDGKRVLFAWKKSLNDDDYHLYEFDTDSAQVRAITSGRGFADYEPTYLPNGDILFSSTRCVQTVDCWWTEVSNLYTCDPDGRFLRRVGFDQVHTLYPQVMDDGRITYTRWDYNDRGQIFPQPLFQMNPDGTGQTEFYGNNSWFPTTIAHARGIPGTQKVLAILCGHHTSQAGKLAVIDPSRGRQENQGVQLVAPIRETPAERIDSYGQEGELWQYPYPLNERECLVGFAPLGWDRPERCRGDADFGIYWMDLDGRRELLVSDAHLPCSQPTPLRARVAPAAWVNRVDHTRTNGTFYLQDIYAGPGLKGVPRGEIRKLRVVALEFRAAGIGDNGNQGPAGAALISTPISIGNGSWDVKVVLGDAKVHEDGSAFFAVPARTPVYFQALNQRGEAVQTMRSWSTLQPGEAAACVGCHDEKNSAPPMYAAGATLALRAGPQALEPFYGPPRGFSYAREVQPVFDRHCTRCHNDPTKQPPATRSLASGPRASAATRNEGADDEPAFSLLGRAVVDRTAKRQWSESYLALTRGSLGPDDYGRKTFLGDPQGRLVNWIGAQSPPEPLPPYFAGAARSELMSLLRSNHKGVLLTDEELDKLSCWIDLLVPYCGTYQEANAWTEEEAKKYASFLEKRQRMQAIERENIRELIATQRSGIGRNE